MNSVILAGGKGTRLRPLTVYTPKPIVPIVNRPFLLYQLDILKRAGIRKATLSLSYLPDKIEQVIGNSAPQGLTLNFTTEPQPLGTAGAFRFASGELREPCVVLNGDILTDLKIEEVIEAHKKNRADATIVLMPVENPEAFGLVETDEDLKVVKFSEKPTAADLMNSSNRNINAGIYVLSPEVLDFIPKDESYSFEYDLFPQLVADGKRVFAYVLLNNYWIDIGTPQRYLKVHHDFLAGKIKAFPIERKRNFDLATAASVDDVSVIDDDCVIKPGARIINSVLGKGVHVDERTTVENSVIWSHTRIAGGSKISGAVIGRGCHIGKNVAVSNGAVIGDKTSLADYTEI
jgi:NDP-sugar pyrophosphorylase family protein